MYGSVELLSDAGRYNTVANERLFEKCAELSDSEYRKPREGSFGSIHGLLNHILFGDRIWMARFDGRGHVTPPLNTVRFEDLADLRLARMEQDAGIESYFRSQDAGVIERRFTYTNN